MSNYVELWDLQDTMCVARLQSAKWVGGHQLLVQSPHTLHLLDVSTRKLLRTLDIPPDTKVLAAKDNIAVLGGGSPLSLSLWDIEANARLAGFNFDQLYMPTLSEVEFDGSQLRVLYHLPAKNRVYDFSFILEDPAASPPVRALSEPVP